jgi:hypothetical protein
MPSMMTILSPFRVMMGLAMEIPEIILLFIIDANADSIN